MTETKDLIREEYVSIQKDKTISEMIGKLKEADERYVLVFDRSDFLGLIVDKWLLKTKIDTTKLKVGALVKQIPVISPDQDLIDVAYLMYQSDVSILPVKKNKKIIGIINGLDLIKELAWLERIRRLKVKQVKLISVPELKPDDPISKAMATMRKLKIWQLPVIENKQCVGLLSYRDFLKKYLSFPVKGERSFKNTNTRTRAFQSETPEIDKLPVNSFDTHDNLLIVDEKNRLSRAIELMCEKNLSCAVITAAGEISGLLTLKSILRKIASLKIPKKYNLFFVGLNELSIETKEKNRIKEIASIESEKIQRDINNEFSMHFHFKEYKKSGKKNKKKKYSVHIRLEFPSKTISSKGQVETWDLTTALHQGIDNIRNELKKKFHGDSSRRKTYE